MLFLDVQCILAEMCSSRFMHVREYLISVWPLHFSNKREDILRCKLQIARAKASAIFGGYSVYCTTVVNGHRV